MDNHIEIHEFSTGIKPDRDSKGNWISRGFTGGYMNCTLPEIPYNVERAIVNHQFAIVEGFTTDQPAFIGRLVPGRSNSPNELGKLDWSVVAIVSRGRDEKGRPLSVYRYFLCKEEYGLLKIVTWIEKQKDNLPKFDPFTIKERGQPNIFENYSPPLNNNLISEEVTRILNQNDIPRIALLQQSQEINLSDIHYFTLEVLQKIQKYNKSFSWAYNVEALEEPCSFIFINTANVEAYKRIKDTIRGKTKNIPVIHSGFDLRILKSAIKSLISGSVSSKAIELIFFEALQNSEELTEDVWQKLFDSEGANRAIKKHIYSSQMLRILTLRAIAIHNTLPEFLDWFSADYVKKNQEEFLEFSGFVKSQLNNNQKERLKSDLFEGIREIFVTNKVSNSSSEFFDNLIILLTDNNSLWDICLGRVIRRVYRDLELIARTSPGMNSEGFYYSEVLWQEIMRNWNDLESGKKFAHKEDRTKYLRFANLFSRLSKCIVDGQSRLKAIKITAYFCQISKGEVPDKLFKNAFENNKSEERFLGITILRQLTFDEKVINQTSNVLKIITKPIKYIWNNIIDNIRKFTIPILILGLITILINLILIESNIEDKAKENFNKSINMLSDLSKNMPNKNLSINEKSSLVINEMLLDNCLTNVQENEQTLLFPPEHKLNKIKDDCREKLVKDFITYEENIEQKNNQIESDGIIDKPTINYITSQISGILEPEKERYRQFTFKILKDFVAQVDRKINEIKDSLEYENEKVDKQFINKWFIPILKQSIVPKGYSEEFLQYSVIENLKNINDIKVYKDFIQQKPKGLKYKNSRYLREWAERFFIECINSYECQISSTKDNEQNANQFRSTIIPNLISQVEEQAKSYLDRYLITKEIKERLEQKFSSKKVSLESAILKFTKTRKAINSIKEQIYQNKSKQLTTKQGIVLNQNQEQNIKKEIDEVTRQVLDLSSNGEPIDINEIDLDKVKNIKLDQLEKTINFDNLGYFRNQLLWIGAIYDYQTRSNLINDSGLIADGIISDSNSGTGKKLKEELISSEQLNRRIKNIVP